jgi:hypothetical protein
MLFSRVQNAEQAWIPVLIVEQMKIDNNASDGGKVETLEKA